MSIKRNIPYVLKLILTSEVYYTDKTSSMSLIICLEIDLIIHDNIVMLIPQYSMYITCFIACNPMKTSPTSPYNLTYAGTSSLRMRKNEFMRTLCSACPGAADDRVQFNFRKWKEYLVPYNITSLL